MGDLCPEEVIGARGAPCGEFVEPIGGEEVEHDGGVGEVTDLSPVGRHQTADHRCEGCGPRPPLDVRKRLVGGDAGPERSETSVPFQVARRGVDNLE